MQHELWSELRSQMATKVSDACILSARLAPKIKARPTSIGQDLQTQDFVSHLNAKKRILTDKPGLELHDFDGRRLEQTSNLVGVDFSKQAI